MTDKLTKAGEIIAQACGEYTSFTYRHDNEPEENGFRFGAFVYHDDEAFHGYGATLAEALAEARRDREQALEDRPISHDVKQAFAAEKGE